MAIPHALYQENKTFFSTTSVSNLPTSEWCKVFWIVRVPMHLSLCLLRYWLFSCSSLLQLLCSTSLSRCCPQGGKVACSLHHCRRTSECLPYSLFLKFSQVRYWQPIPPLQTASISLFPPNFQLVQAESERHVWHVDGMSPFPYTLYTFPTPSIYPL